MTLVCQIHATKELTKLGSCVSCRKRVQGIQKPDTAPNSAVVQPGETPSFDKTQETVTRLLEAVDNVTTDYAPERDKQVRQIACAILSPIPNQEIPPVKRGRGRPRKYAGVTVQERERNRKRDERTKAKDQLVRLLRHFNLEWDSPIPPGLKTKYGLEYDTYRELLEEIAGKKRVMTRVYKDIIRDLKMIGKVHSMLPMGPDGLPRMSAGRYITEADPGKGELIVLADPSKIHGTRQTREAGLSGHKDEEEYLDIPMSPLGNDKLIVDQGARRRVKPEGHGSDDQELDQE